MQAKLHRWADEQQAQVVAAADANAAQVRAEVAAPLIELATADGSDDLSARERMWQANRALHATGRFGGRPAARTAREATEAHSTAEDAVRRRWDDVPLRATHLPYWAEAVAGQRSGADPRVIEARQDAERAHLEQRQLTADHVAARAVLWQTIGGGQGPSGVEARVAERRRGEDHARITLAEIEALPVTEAAQLIRHQAAEAAAERFAEAARLARGAGPGRWQSPAPVYSSYPERGFGPSL